MTPYLRGRMPDLRRFLPYLAYPVAGLLVGWISAPVAPAPEDASRHRTRETRPATPAREKDDLLNKARLADAREEKDASRISRQVADWTEEEIRSALDEAMLDPEMQLRHRSIATDLMREFAKRNPEQAFEWATKQPVAIRGRFADLALTGLLPERLDEAIAIAKAHPGLFNGMVPNFIVTASLTAASTQGTAAFISRLQELREDEPRNRPGLPADIAPDFDFAAVLRSPDFEVLGLASMRKSMIRAWAEQDREAAFHWVLQQDGPGAIMNLRKETWNAPHAQNVDMIRWMVGKVETLPAEQQAEFLKAHLDHVSLDGTNATVWIESAKTPELQDAFRAAAVRGASSGHEISLERGLKAAATLADPEARFVLLETLEPVFPGYRPQPEPAAEKLLRTKLAEWGATPSRVDAIVKHLHGDGSLVIPGQE